MKLKHLNPHHVERLVPAWVIEPHRLAQALDDVLAQYFRKRPLRRWDLKLDFWVDIERLGEQWGISIKQPTTPAETAHCGQLIIECAEWCINLPLNAMLKGSDPLDGRYSVYFHAFNVDVPLHYVGITKQRWYERLAQHESSARCGSPFLFHRALREHAGVKTYHRVQLTAVSYEAAMHSEEELVENIGLYPKGLNMIPGGFAGLRYLHTLGIAAARSEERDEAIERLSSQSSIEGRHNPLCAALWASDQDFVNRVVCGHSGRLTVDQVRRIRMLIASGKTTSDIAESNNIPEQKVAGVASGRRYTRVF